MLEKSFEFVCFLIGGGGVACFPPLYTFFQTIEYFLSKIAYIGGKQTNQKNIFKMKSLNVLDAFSFSGCTKSSKFEGVTIVHYCLFSLAHQMKCEVTSKYILNFARRLCAKIFFRANVTQASALGGSSSYIFLENVLFFLACRRRGKI